jgi:hypothetical protein
MLDTDLWGSWTDAERAVHPDAPAGGGGHGFFRAPGPDGMDHGTPSAMPHPDTPAGRTLDSAAVQSAFDTASARAGVARLQNVSHWSELRFAAEAILGPYSFGVGVCAGIVKNPLSGVVSLLELEKMFVLADLHDRLTKPLSWRTFLEFGSALQIGADLALLVGVIDMADREGAARRRDALIHELIEVFKHPLDFLGALPSRIRDDYVQKWTRFKELSGSPALKSQFQAGEVLGDVLMDVAMAVLGVVSGVGAAARIASKVPELMKVAGLFKDARLARRVTLVADAADESAAAARAARGAAPPSNPAIARAPAQLPPKAPPAPAAKPAKSPKPIRAQATPTLKGPPVLRGVSAEEVRLASSPDAIPGDPAARAARRKVVARFLEEYGREWQGEPKPGGFVKMDRAEIASQMKGYDFGKPVTVGPPPPCPNELYQWQKPGGNKGQYFAEGSSQPANLGISPKAGMEQPGGAIQEVDKVQVKYKIANDPAAPGDPSKQVPYMKSTADRTVDDWSIKNKDVQTSGGDTQYTIGDRAFSS